MSITNHVIWDKVKPFVDVQVYAPDGGHKNPRVRIELRRVPVDLAGEFLAATMPCVCCGNTIHPIRHRAAPTKRGAAGNLYYAPSCPLSVSVGCSRGSEARDEYSLIKSIFRPDLGQS